MAYGAMLFATALNHDSMSENFANTRRMPVWLALGREVAAIALARGVTPRGFGSFEPMAFAPGRADADGIKVVEWLRDYTAVGAKTHSGIWRDLAVRKRKTEVDPQIGVIAEIGREVGVPTPAIRCLVALIHAIEDGSKPMSSDTFSELMAVCERAPAIST
jgi:2-dehydropantoate 2-reductase